MFDILKLRQQCVDAQELNQFFIDNDYKGHQDLDTIATYLAAQLNEEYITQKMVDRLPELIGQITSVLRAISKDEK